MSKALWLDKDQLHGSRPDRCPECERAVKRYKNGHFRRHGPRESPCPGDDNRCVRCGTKAWYQTGAVGRDGRVPICGPCLEPPPPVDDGGRSS